MCVLQRWLSDTAAVRTNPRRNVRENSLSHACGAAQRARRLVANAAANDRRSCENAARERCLLAARSAGDPVLTPPVSMHPWGVRSQRVVLPDGSVGPAVIAIGG